MPMKVKFIVSFGLILVLLGAVALWSTTGINGIVDNAGEVIEA